METCDDYNFVRLIGNSAFSSTAIYLVQHRQSMKPKALRQTNLEQCSLDCISFLQRELWISRELNHKNILVHESAFVEKMMLCVVTEFMNFGACYDLLESYFHYGLPEKFISYALKEVLHALCYIHHLGFIHRGVKACHILVSGEGQIKLAGNRNMVSMNNKQHQTGSVHDFPKHDTHLLPWLSPEILQQNMEGYNVQSDIYSLGITACELANGHAPFTDMPSTQMLLAKLNGTKPCLLDKTTLPGANDEDLCKNPESQQQHEVAKFRIFTEAFHDFTSECLTRDPNERPSALQLLSHPFLSNHLPIKVHELLHPLVSVTPEMQTAPSDEIEKELKEATKMAECMTTSEYNWEFGEE